MLISYRSRIVMIAKMRGKKGQRCLAKTSGQKRPHSLAKTWKVQSIRRRDYCFQSNQLYQQNCLRRRTHLARNCPLKILRSYVWKICFTQLNRMKKLNKTINKYFFRVLEYRNGNRVLGRPSEYSSTRILVAIPTYYTCIRTCVL